MDIMAIYQDWAAGLTAADHVTLLAIGFGLMIFAVAALLWQRSREKSQSGLVRAPQQAEMASIVPGERHVVAREKGDAFMRRLDRLA
ncbi:hypothetical protein [Celeribacter sp. PS-C1]|uniref:hypothetical protein n=1 Tax=Celeribacter sp. PS-C1 TaxID=2820813 RepID=UPI001CA48A5D|nr:hypothetical protein [Celeribacter sp. PS-C1]MBW6418847.1 hypothetical protein [Celeribacter sp. PS-C1]